MLGLMLPVLGAALLFSSGAEAHAVHDRCAYGPTHSGTTQHFHPGGYGLRLLRCLTHHKFLSNAELFEGRILPSTSRATRWLKFGSGGGVYVRNRTQGTRGPQCR